MVVLNEAGALALMLAIFAGALALVVQMAWEPAHDCGNRYCKHVQRRDDDDVDWRRP